MYIEEDIELGNYPCICREIVYVPPFDLIIRFYLNGNDEWDIEFKKTYNSKETLVDSITKYKSETVHATNGSVYDEQKINASMIQLLKTVVDKTIHLPDNGQGFILRGDTDNYMTIIDMALRGEDVGFFGR